MNTETQVADGPTASTEVQAFADLDPVADETLGEQSSSAAAETATGETDEAEQGAEATGETAEEAADDWLPTEQEKVFPAEVLAKYAPRYGFAAEELQGDPRIARIVQDKLNSDIYIRQLQNREADEPDQTAEEPTLEQPETAQVPATPEQVQQYVQDIEQNAPQYIHPEVGKHFGQKIGTTLLKAFGVDTNSKDPQVQALVKSVGNVAPELTNVLAEMALAFNTTLARDPQFSQFVVRQGMGESYASLQESQRESDQARSWNEVIGNDPAYQGLPKAGTPEWEEALAKVQEAFPAITRTVFMDEKGKPLPRAQQYREKSLFAAKYLAGLKASPESTKRAVETGRKLERQSIVAKQSGKLGPGQSKGGFGNADASGNPIRDKIMELRRVENPFGAQGS